MLFPLLLVIGWGCEDSCARQSSGLPLDGKLKMKYWRAPFQNDIERGDPRVEYGIIIVHGTNRNADDYFCWMFNAAEYHFCTDIYRAYVISPQFQIPSDKPEPFELYWDTNELWKSGELSTVNHSPRYYSYGVLDKLVGLFANATLFPKIKQIIIAGHSAGGQVVTRYSLVSGELRSRPDIAVRYFPANPSGFVYLNNERSVNLPPRKCDVYCDNRTIPTQIHHFAVPSTAEIAKCPTYNHWKYGIEKLQGYASTVDIQQCLKDFPSKKVYYLQGSADVCNTELVTELNCTQCDDHGLETNCDVDFQGNCRFQRGVAYFQHLHAFYGRAVHQLVPVAGVEHDACNMLHSPEALDVMFPDPPKCSHNKKPNY